METTKKTRKILIIAGPTGIGKTNMSFHLAQKLNGEIISADSMQFYKELNIGTDKVSRRIREVIPHHLIDCISLKDNFDVNTFTEKSFLKIEEILQKGKTPIIVGGSGLYIRSLIRGVFPMPEEKIEEQLKVRNLLYRKNVVELYDKLKSIDLEAATKIHQNDKKRIIRALEVYQLTGQNITFWHKQKPENSIIQIGDPIYFILTRNREVMYNRIDKRVEEMINLGWIKEVEELVEKGYTEMLLNKAPIGYAEILDFLSGKYDMDELKYKIKKRTRTFARKQVTWFKKEEGIWLNIENEEEAVNLIIEKFLTFEEGVE